MASPTYEEFATVSDPSMELMLNSSSRKYSLAEFRDLRGIRPNLDDEGRFWGLLDYNSQLEITEPILNWCGYKGQLYHQKDHFKRHLKGNKIPFDEQAIDNRSTRLLISSQNFNIALMRMRNHEADNIRDWMIRYRDIAALYTSYERAFERKEMVLRYQTLSESCARAEARAQRSLAYSSDTVDDLRKVTQDFESSIVHTTVQPEQHRINTCYAMILIKKWGEGGFRKRSANEGYVYTIYTVRGQVRHVPKKLIEIKKDHPDAEVTQLAIFLPEANPINLYNRVKTAFKKRDTGLTVLPYNFIELGASVTPNEFVELVSNIRNENAAKANQALAVWERRHREYSVSVVPNQ